MFNLLSCLCAGRDYVPGFEALIKVQPNPCSTAEAMATRGRILNAKQ